MSTEDPKDAVSERHSPAAQVALVTGASRGIGAAVARNLADEGLHVLVNYREKAKRAQRIVEDIRSAGGQASTVGADISDEAAAATLIATIARQFGQLHVLILNASGGLERGADADYAMRLNRDAQVRLVELAAPLMPVGSRIVFVTSHQAHFYPHNPVPNGYEEIAGSKRAGEDALLAMRPELARRGIELRVVSGDMIDGTIIVRLLHRRDPRAVETRRTHGPLPTVIEFATAITRAGVSAQHPSTTFVGGEDLYDAGTFLQF
jgi:NAD(P)-dependent dehydrogenase (short-subunit alcohol dehydrogenase family)